MGRKAHVKAERLAARLPSPAPPTPGGGRISAILTADRTRSVGGYLAGALLLLVLVAACLVPRVCDDTFIGLAGGRDVSQGKLGKPDDWSFVTAGRVWMNQNWGFDSIAYDLFKTAGETGLLALRFLLIVAGAAAVVFAARRRGADWDSAILLTAAAMAGMRWHFVLRASLASHVMVALELMILYWSRSRPRVVWATVALIAAWANLHGSFMLGFGLLGLWAAANGLVALRTEGLRAAFRQAWEPMAALGVSIVLAAVLSPFGIKNLTHPFTITSSTQWRKISEWAPVSLTRLQGPSTAWELLLLLGLILAVTAWKASKTRRSRGRAASVQRVLSGVVVFDAGLVIVMTAMALSAVRFVSLALIALAPLAAAQATALFRAPRLAALPAISALALAIPMFAFATGAAARYAPGNPRFTDETFFQKMVGIDRMPAGAAGFLEENKVRGRMFSDWSWEGFLHWRLPQLQTFLGGRAQQIYTLGDIDEYQRILTSQRPADDLARWDVHLAVLPFGDTFVAFIQKLTCLDGATWAVVFYDGKAVVLADLREPAMRTLADAVAGGHARFRDERVAALSRALCRTAALLGNDRAKALADLVAANDATPTAGGPWFVLLTANAQRVRPEWLVDVLERQDKLLSGEAAGSMNPITRIEARRSIATILATVFRGGGRTTEAMVWASNAADLSSQLESILAGP